MDLHCHPNRPPAQVSAVTGRITREADWLRLRWRVDGAQQLVIPPFAGKGRADNLWQTTCFELFLQVAGEPGYIELNLSPSERWAAYAFEARRKGLCEQAMPREPTCTMRMGQAMAIFDAAVPVSALPKGPWMCGMTAVIEEAGGVKSYWALAHTGAEPDFHDPACFIAAVEAPNAA